MHVCSTASTYNLAPAVKARLLLCRSSGNRRSCLKTFLERGNGAAHRHAQPPGGFEWNEIAHPVPDNFNNGAILLGHVGITRQLHGSAPLALFKVEVAKLLFDKPQSVRVQQG